MWLFLLWWCVDDHLAQLLGRPELGHLPWWFVLVIAAMLGEAVQVRATVSKE
jgi:hypothetical protein